MRPPPKALLACVRHRVRRGLSWFGPSQQWGTRWLLHRPSPLWEGEENGKKKAKLMVRDKDNLTEQQGQRTVTTTILLIRIQKSQGETQSNSLPTRGPVHSWAAAHLPPASPHSTLSMTAQGIKYPVHLASLGQLAWLCPLLASGKNSPYASGTQDRALQGKIC